jgi:hypothetical protein
MDLSRASLSNLGDRVVLTDPIWPWTVEVRLAHVEGRPVIVGLAVESHNKQPITTTALTRIPLRQIASVAASAMAGEGEAQYRMLAQPRPAGKRGWPPDHYSRVARVASWARATGRPGGPACAVAEFWGVHHRTARRWLASVRP